MMFNEDVNGKLYSILAIYRLCLVAVALCLVLRMIEITCQLLFTVLDVSPPLDTFSLAFNTRGKGRSCF